MFSYSFRARDNMKVSGSSTRLGQMKGVDNGFQLKGNPLFSLTANNNGINVRFNNEESDNVEGMDEYLSWEDSVGEWVNVEIKTTFGKSMEVCSACAPVDAHKTQSRKNLQVIYAYYFAYLQLCASGGAPHPLLPTEYASFRGCAIEYTHP